MATLLSTTQQDSVLKNVFNGETIATGSRYLALFNGDPHAGGTELTTSITGAAARLQVDGEFAVPTTVGGYQQTSNESALTITASAVNVSNETATYFAIYDASTAGNLIAGYALTSALIIATGNAVEFAIGQLVVTFADPA